MNRIEIDCAVFKTKNQLLNEISKHFDEMYSANYDAFIDAAREADRTHIVFLHSDNYEDSPLLLEVLNDIAQENPDFTYEIK